VEQDRTADAQVEKTGPARKNNLWSWPPVPVLSPGCHPMWDCLFKKCGVTFLPTVAVAGF
jgi:hypothetical protein